MLLRSICVMLQVRRCEAFTVLSGAGFIGHPGVSDAYIGSGSYSSACAQSCEQTGCDEGPQRSVLLCYATH